jgi:hypothetical protein
MRIALDPVPVVLGIYAHVGALLGRAAERREEAEAEALGRRFGRQRAEAADREVQRLVHVLHADVKTADKLLKKTGDVWKISRETDLVDLVVQARGEEPEPQSYVLLKPADVRAVLLSIRDAARGAGEDEETIAQLDRAADALEARPGDYLAFGFDPWGS